MILRTLCNKPLARKVAGQYLERMAQVEPMQAGEVRRRLKQLEAERRAKLLNGIPNCAWKARAACHLHKHLFLDYLSGEWLLDALVDYYNLEKGERIAGRFRFGGNLTARGANGAMAGILPENFRGARAQASTESVDVRAIPGPGARAEAGTEAEEPNVDDLMPPEPKGGSRLLQRAQDRFFDCPCCRLKAAFRLAAERRLQAAAKNSVPRRLQLAGDSVVDALV